MNTRNLISNICYVGCVICALLALGALERDDDEIAAYLDASLPADAFLIRSRIGREFGVFAATYWQYAVYEGNPRQAEAILGEALREREIRSQIQKAQAANFYVPPDTKRDQQIMRRYSRIRERAPDLQRRTALSQRFKDMMAYIGGAAVLGFLGFHLAKPKNNEMP